eukprot:scaffold4306_cov114-Isochrysis_galbana.AAC.9
MRASGCVSLMTSFVLGRVMLRIHWLLLRHDMKLVQPPAVSSIQRDLTVKRVHRSSSMRHMYTLVMCLQKSSYSIQKVPSRIVGPFTVPLLGVAIFVERDAQPHQLVVLEVATRHYAVSAVEQYALGGRLRPRLPLGGARAAHHVLGLHLLHDLVPQPAGRVALGHPLLDTTLLRVVLCQVKLVADAARQVLETLDHRAALHRLVRARVLGKYLLHDHHPVNRRVDVAREGRVAVGSARNAVVDDDHLPVVVGERVVAVDLADEEALVGVQLRLAEEEPVELLAVARHDVDGREQPLVVDAKALHYILDLPVVLEELRRGAPLARPPPLRDDWHAGHRRAPAVHGGLVIAGGAARGRREVGVLEEPAPGRGIGERLLDQLLFALLHVVRERLALDGHHWHILHPLLQPRQLLELHLLRIADLARVAQLLARLGHVMLGCRRCQRLLCVGARSRDALRPRAVAAPDTALRYFTAVERFDVEGLVGAVEGQVKAALIAWMEGAREEGVGARRRKRYLGRHLLRADGELGRADQVGRSLLVDAGHHPAARAKGEEAERRCERAGLFLQRVRVGRAPLRRRLLRLRRQPGLRLLEPSRLVRRQGQAQHSHHRRRAVDAHLALRVL